jgi:signal peptidase I
VSARLPAAVPVVAAAGAAAGLLARRRLRLVRVHGGSMAPTLADGDRLLVRRTGTVRAGRLVVFRNPAPAADPPWLVKRAVATAGEAVPAALRAAVAPDRVVPAGCLLVRGDAERSQDSRHFGYVHTVDVLGVPLGSPRRVMFDRRRESVILRRGGRSRNSSGGGAPWRPAWARASP